MQIYEGFHDPMQQLYEAILHVGAQPHPSAGHEIFTLFIGGVYVHPRRHHPSRLHPPALQQHHQLGIQFPNMGEKGKLLKCCL